MPFSFNFLPIEIYKFSDRNDEWSTQNHISPIGTDTLWQMHLRHTVAIDINWMAFFFIYMNRNKWNKTRPSLITTIATQNHTNHFRISIQITISISIIICDIRNLPAAENELHDLAFTDRAKEVNVFLLFFFWNCQLERILKDDNWRTVCLFYMHCMPHELSARCEV